MAIERAEAELIFGGPSRIADGAPAEWKVLRSFGGDVLRETVEFAIYVEAPGLTDDLRHLVVSGRQNGDRSHVIALQPPLSTKILARLCTAPDHPAPHWHWFENAVSGAGHTEDLPAGVAAELNDPEDLLVHFCSRLNITGLQIQRTLRDEG